VLLRAFWDAFEATDDVALFVRTSLDERAQAELKVRARGHPCGDGGECVLRACVCGDRGRAACFNLM
jgi:hypothetical protein